MKNLSQVLKSFGLSALLIAALPVAASAMTIGVTDEVGTTISSGHLCQSSYSQSVSQGTEYSNSSSSKSGHEHDVSSTGSSVVDPANSSSSVDGKFAVNASTNSGTQGTYSNYSESQSSVTGGVQASTDIFHTVSTFANP